MKVAGISNGDAARAMNAIFSCSACQDDISNTLALIDARTRASWEHDSRNYDHKSVWERRIEGIVSSWLHLVDLKRAGHSPAQTEYDISDDSLQHFPLTQSRSYIGSSAASCAEIA
jgi:hypothetical protein